MLILPVLHAPLPATSMPPDSLSDDDAVFLRQCRKDEGTGWTFHPCEEMPLRDALDTALYTIREHPDAFWGMKYRMVTRPCLLDANSSSPRDLASR